MGWQIVRHSLMLLFRNLPQALRVSIGPILIAALLSTAALMMGGVHEHITGIMLDGAAVPNSVVLAFLFVLLVMVFAFAWIAVSWHRFVLLEEYPGLLPAIGDRPIWPYAGRSALLGLLLLLAMLPALVIAGLVTGLFGNARIIQSIVGLAVGVLFSYLWLRLALILPAVAVGNRMRIAEAWAVTAPVSSTILQTAAVLVALNVLASLFAELFGIGLIGLIVQVMISWITLMAGTSILTTLYGILVERRELPA